MKTWMYVAIAAVVIIGIFLYFNNSASASTAKDYQSQGNYQSQPDNSSWMSVLTAFAPALTALAQNAGNKSDPKGTSKDEPYFYDGGVGDDRSMIASADGTGSNKSGLSVQLSKA